MACAKCGGEFRDGIISLIGKGVRDKNGRAIHEDYCFSRGMDELGKRLRSVPLTIEIPHYPEYTSEELSRCRAAINYTAELIDFPPSQRVTGLIAGRVRGAQPL